MSFGSLKSSFVSAALLAATLVFGFAGASTSAQAQTYTVLYTASGPPGVQNPQGTISQGRDGNMYTVSNTGGTFYGTAFKFSPSGALAVINDVGYFPSGGLTLGTDGNFYGQDGDGGVVGNCGLAAGGQVYKLTPAGAMTVLHNFTGGTDGCNPAAAPIEGANGIFYGTTPNANNGTVYSVTSGGLFTTLHTFTGADGQGVYAPLVQGTDGNFYGDTVYGGTNGVGVIFKMTPAGTVTVLHNFAGAPDGAQAYNGLTQASDGNFYGVTFGGGTFYGTVFKMTPTGVLSVLHTFADGPSDGAGPSSSLTQGTDGKLYGVTSAGGTTGGGTIYSITTSGAYSVLYNFEDTNSTTGYNPASPLHQSSNGKFYGDTSNGGEYSTCNCGVIYSFDVGLSPFVSPETSSAKEGAKVGLLGQGFSSASVVKFGGVAATLIARGGTTFISATVPTGALTGSITVTTGATTLKSPQAFKIAPTLTTFDPPSGPVGTSVTITGTAYTQATKVVFNGISAAFTVNSDTQITATVPAGATTGKIGVGTKGGSIASTTNFTVN
jgi:uncharacterized repeat protein (TIGR03803 family)